MVNFSRSIIHPSRKKIKESLVASGQLPSLIIKRKGSQQTTTKPLEETEMILGLESG